jgi:leucyl aminopeptidase
VRLVAPGADLAEVRRIQHACALARDMVNTPANDMGPHQMESIAREIAESNGATVTVTTGAELLADNYPAVHAVGRAATGERAPADRGDALDGRRERAAARRHRQGRRL